MEFEDELTELFDSATAALRPPIDEIAQQSAAQGQRLRRRRRNTRAAMGACGITVIVCGTAFGVVHAASPAPSSTLAVGAASTTTTPANTANTANPTATAAPSVTGPQVAGSAAGTAPPSTSASPGQTATKTAASTKTPTSTSTGASGAAHGTNFDLLKSLMPAGADLKPNSYDVSPPGAANALYDDGHGLSVLSVTRFKASQANPDFDCATWLGGTDEGKRPAGALPVSCAVVTLPNGDIESSVVTGVDGSGFYDAEVTLILPDGSMVAAVSTNGVPEGANVVVTRAVPPLSIAELKVLAATPGWQVG